MQTEEYGTSDDKMNACETIVPPVLTYDANTRMAERLLSDEYTKEN